MKYADDDAVERACEKLSVAFANCIDRRDYDAVVDLFTTDGILDRWGNVIQGHAALQHWLDARPRDVTTSHVCSNIVVERSSPDEAWGTTYFTFYSATQTEGCEALPLEGPTMVGEYHDHFVLTERGWRLGKRTVLPKFKRR
jgi:SnoaL-like domain